MKLESSNYQSNILRMWAVENDGGLEWRIIIEKLI
jgi:hypothetical protein